MTNLIFENISITKNNDPIECSMKSKPQPQVGLKNAIS